MYKVCSLLKQFPIRQLCVTTGFIRNIAPFLYLSGTPLQDELLLQKQCRSLKVSSWFLRVARPSSEFQAIQSTSYFYALRFQLQETFSCSISRGQHLPSLLYKLLHISRILPGGVGVTCVSEVGEGWGESCSPICREKRDDLSRGVKVEQAVSKGARRLH